MSAPIRDDGEAGLEMSANRSEHHTDSAEQEEGKILDAIREGIRINIGKMDAAGSGDNERVANTEEDTVDDESDLVEVPFASEDSAAVPSAQAEDDTNSALCKITVDVDDIGRSALAAYDILKSSEISLICAGITDSSLKAYSSDDDGQGNSLLDQCTAQEGRVLVRLLYLLNSQKQVEGSSIGNFSVSAVAGMLENAQTASLPWHIRAEFLRCLWEDITPTSLLIVMGRKDWNSILRLVEGVEVSTADGSTTPLVSRSPPAQVRSAALKIISSHRHVQSLPRLINLCSRYDDNSNESNDSKTPLPGWYDGLRQIELTRALLGDVGCYVALIVRLYDPTEAARKEAEAVLESIATDIGGKAEIARRIILDHELLDDKGEMPDFVGTSFSALDAKVREEDKDEVERACRIWEYLRMRHWNEIIIRWASESLKSAL